MLSCIVQSMLEMWDNLENVLVGGPHLFL